MVGRRSGVGRAMFFKSRPVFRSIETALSEREHHHAFTTQGSADTNVYNHSKDNINAVWSAL
eukprot:8271217-Lingulodinium_polyedra.AAC.1